MRKAIANISDRRKKAQHIGIRVDFEVSIGQEFGDPSDFITVYRGSAIATMNDDSERKIGKVTIYIVERGRILNEGMSLFEVMDSLDGDSCDCFANLFDHKTEELKPVVQRLTSEDRSLDWDLMLIEHLELDQEYRGQGIGKRDCLDGYPKAWR